MGAPQGEWFPDPSGRHESRWWDGAEWTLWVGNDGEMAEDPDGAVGHPPPGVRDTPRPPPPEGSRSLTDAAWAIVTPICLDTMWVKRGIRGTKRIKYFDSQAVRLAHEREAIEPRVRHLAAEEPGSAEHLAYLWREAELLAAFAVMVGIMAGLAGKAIADPWWEMALAAGQPLDAPHEPFPDEGVLQWNRWLSNNTPEDLGMVR